MQLYNRLTRRVEPFTSLNPQEVTIYSCGPTVYDHAHIGNLSSYIFADTLRRTLTLAGFKVKHAMNYTDVDDKTIRRSREHYPGIGPNEALHKLTDEYITLFLEDMHTIGNDVKTLIFLRATETIEEMKALIINLHDKGFAYVADDGVYFSIQAYQESGKTYGQLLEITTTNTSEARIQNDEYDKDSIHDFALWKKQKEGEPAWKFTLEGQDMTGRPGWHIECSVMSKEALGQPFDIHTGGVDLIFPHHENEIAQSTAGEDNPIMATFFTHNEHILVDGKKMAKSAQNFYTIQDVVKLGFDPLAFRLLVLQTHYRSQVHFSWENLQAAQNRLERWRATACLRWQVLQPPQFLKELPANETAFDTLAQTHPHTVQTAAFLKQTKTALEDDLDTPLALSAIDRMMNYAEQEGLTSFMLQNFTHMLQLLDRTFGIALFTEDITDVQKQLIYQRQEARVKKDFAKADELRQQLGREGLTVRDTPNGPIWARNSA